MFTEHSVSIKGKYDAIFKKEKNKKELLRFKV